MDVFLLYFPLGLIDSFNAQRTCNQRQNYRQIMQIGPFGTSMESDR